MGFFDFLKGKKKELEVPVEAFTPWVHRSSHLAMLNQILRQRQQPPMYLTPLNDVFALCLAARTTKGPIPLTPEQLRQHGLGHRDALVQAITNAVPHFQKTNLIRSTDVGGMAIWQTEPDLSGVLLPLAASRVAALPFKGQAIMMIPTDQLAIMADADDLTALEGMLQLATEHFHSSPEWRSLRPVALLVDGTTKEWLPPEGHPLRAKFAAAAAKTKLVEAKHTHSFFRDAVPAPLAPLASLPDRGTGAFVASWFREATVLIPSTVERVVLLDTDDSPIRRLELDFELLREALPEAFEPVTMATLAGEAEGDDEQGEEAEAKAPHPLFWRTRGVVFPSPRMLAFLKERAALDAAKAERTSRDVAAAVLLAAWDAGEPIIIDHEAGKPGHVRLVAPDRRVAPISNQQIRSRVKQLSAHDQLAFHSGLMSSLLLLMMAEADQDHIEAEAEALAPDDREAGPSMEALLSQRNAERLALLSAMPPKDDEADQEGVEAQALEMLRATMDPATVFPVIRPPGYDEAQRANQQGMVAHLGVHDVIGFDGVSRSFEHGLSLQLVSDSGDRMFSLNAGFVSDREAAWRTAQLNLEANSVQPFEATATPGVYVAPWNDGYDVSRLLLVPGLVGQCQVKGTPLAFAPHVNKVWVVGSEDEAGLKYVFEQIDAFFESEDSTSPYQFRSMLFGWPWAFDGGAPKRWTIPPQHPFAARITALDEALTKRRSTSARHIEALGRATYGSST